MMRSKDRRETEDREDETNKSEFSKNYTIKSIIVIIIGFSIFKINTIVLKRKSKVEIQFYY